MTVEWRKHDCDDDDCQQAVIDGQPVRAFCGPLSIDWWFESPTDAGIRDTEEQARDAAISAWRGR